jgi:hypothetical protein
MIIFIHVNYTAWLLLIIKNSKRKDGFATSVFVWFLLLRNKMFHEPFEVPMLKLETAKVSGGDRTSNMMIFGI